MQDVMIDLPFERTRVYRLTESIKFFKIKNDNKEIFTFFFNSI